MSAVIAAEAMRRLPRGGAYGAYPANTRFGDFRVDADENLGELVAPDAFLYAGTTRSAPPQPARLQRVAGYSSSPIMTYAGEGIYFLDRVRDGVWRLEVYPDAVPLRDPFEQPSRDKVVTRALAASWPMTVQLPAVVGRVRFDEYRAPPADAVPLAVARLPNGDRVAGRPSEVAARVVHSAPPSAVTLRVRPARARGFRPYPMSAAGAYQDRATLPAGVLREGPYQLLRPRPLLRPLRRPLASKLNRSRSPLSPDPSRAP